MGFPGSSAGKESAWNAGDPGSILFYAEFHTKAAQNSELPVKVKEGWPWAPPGGSLL